MTRSTRDHNGRPVLYGADGRRLEFDEASYDEMNADELLAQDMPPMSYYPILGLDGYIVTGYSHLFAAYPSNGKTEFLAAVVQAWGAAGIKTVWITEESPRLWFDRLQKRPLGPNCGLVFGLGESRERLRYRAVCGDHDVVIFDTIRNLFRPKNENDNSELADLMNPFVQDARIYGKTPIFVHHNRKGREGEQSGNPGKIAGGHPLLGAVDIALVMDSDPHGNKSRRVITTTARVISPPDLIQQLDPATGVFTVSTTEQVQVPAITERVRTIVQDAWMTQAEIALSCRRPGPVMNSCGVHCCNWPRQAIWSETPRLVRRRKVSGCTGVGVTKRRGVSVWRSYSGRRMVRRHDQTHSGDRCNPARRRTSIRLHRPCRRAWQPAEMSGVQEATEDAAVRAPQRLVPPDVRDVRARDGAPARVGKNPS
jgi:hypothetical protein